MPESKRRKRKHTGPTTSTRRSPKRARENPSPPWYLGVMIGLMAAGTVLVVARFVVDLHQMWMIGGFVAIAAGLIMTMRYR